MVVSETGSRWFLAQLKPNAHAIAQRNLLRQGFVTFHPLMDETQRKNGRFVTVQRPVFPGYIFVEFDTASGGWRAVNSTYGVTKLVSFGADPAEVEPGIMAALMHRFSADGAAPEISFKKGDILRAGEGPFVDFVVEVESLAPDQRVWVLLDLMGRRTRVAIPAKDLRET